MQKEVRTYLYFVPLIHILFAVLVYGNTEIFSELSQLSGSYTYNLEVSTGSDVLNKLWQRAVDRPQNVVLTLLFCLVVAFLMIRFMLLRPFKQLVNICFSKILHKYSDMIKVK